MPLPDLERTNRGQVCKGESRNIHLASFRWNVDQFLVLLRGTTEWRLASERNPVCLRQDSATFDEVEIFTNFSLPPNNQSPFD
jgi:hypothetical protein